MNISQTAEYALRAVVWLAGQPADADAGTARIARHTQVPTGYLSKVLHALARAGLVTSRPGRTGGFRLQRPPAELTVLEVINAIDPLERIQGCPLGLKAHGTRLCPLHRRLDAALAHIEQAFGATTIAELLAEQPEGGGLCASETPARRKRSPAR